jgi:ankyrin repeat protein
MAETTRLIEAIPDGPEAVAAVLAEGADPNARDGDDWTALDHAAGAGRTDVVQVLLDHGSDPAASGREQRTAYEIALAAGRRDTAQLLREAEERADPESTARHSWRPYCRAYLLGQLRRFGEWTEMEQNRPTEDGPLADDSVVYVHDDGTVTRSIWPDEDILFAGIGPAWATFLRTDLDFRVPDDFDLLP